MSALTDLLEKVEDGVATGRMFRGTFGSPCHDLQYEEIAHSSHMAYKGSLDAALTLHNAVLLDWEWSVGSGSVYVCKAGFGSFGFGGLFFERPITHVPARAWLIVILKALIAQEGKA